MDELSGGCYLSLFSKILYEMSRNQRASGSSVVNAKRFKWCSDESGIHSLYHSVSITLVLHGDTDKAALHF